MKKTKVKAKRLSKRQKPGIKKGHRKMKCKLCGRQTENHYKRVIICRNCQSDVADHYEREHDDLDDFLIGMGTLAETISEMNDAGFEVGDSSPSFHGDGGEFGGAGASSSWDDSSSSSDSNDYSSSDSGSDYSSDSGSYDSGSSSDFGGGSSDW